MEFQCTKKCSFVTRSQDLIEYHIENCDADLKDASVHEKLDADICPVCQDVFYTPTELLKHFFDEHYCLKCLKNCHCGTSTNKLAEVVSTKTQTDVTPAVTKVSPKLSKVTLESTNVTPELKHVTPELSIVTLEPTNVTPKVTPMVSTDTQTETQTKTDTDLKKHEDNKSCDKINKENECDKLLKQNEIRNQPMIKVRSDLLSNPLNLPQPVPLKKVTKSHMETIHKNPEMKKLCGICFERFDSMPQFEKHWSEVHQGKKVKAKSREIKCDICDLVFNSNAFLFQHINNVHKKVGGFDTDDAKKIHWSEVHQEKK